MFMFSVINTLLSYLKSITAMKKVMILKICLRKLVNVKFLVQQNLFMDFPLNYTGSLV